MSGFSTGGVVKILANEKALKLLQEGHGGYNADVGKVHNYDSAVRNHGSYDICVMPFL